MKKSNDHSALQCRTMNDILRKCGGSVVLTKRVTSATGGVKDGGKMFKECGWYEVGKTAASEGVLFARPWLLKLCVCGGVYQCPY